MDRELHNKLSNKEFRRGLRKNMPAPEIILWQKVRGKQLGGYKIRRQHGIGSYIVDFYCAKCKLAIEIDGDSHYDKKGVARDRERSIFLADNGIRVMRFSNNEIMNDLDGVLEKIQSALKETCAGTSNPL